MRYEKHFLCFEIGRESESYLIPNLAHCRANNRGLSNFFHIYGDHKTWQADLYLIVGSFLFMGHVFYN
jgi:hypothetical protein